ATQSDTHAVDGDVAAVPFDPEFEVLVRVEPMGVDGELRHSPAPSLQVASNLLNGDDHEFRRLQRREADDDVDDAEVAIGLRRGLLVALDEEGLGWRLALERALPEQAVHERAD